MHSASAPLPPVGQARLVLKRAGEEDGLRSASLANTFDLLIDLHVFCADFGIALHGRPFLNRTIDAAATHAGLTRVLPM